MEDTFRKVFFKLSKVFFIAAKTLTSIVNK
jgi:hypothetical protein